MQGKIVQVRIKRLPHGEGLPIPAYQTVGAAGLDLVAAVPPDAPITLNPGAFALIPTGLTLEIPENFEAQVRPRSGLAFKHGVTVLNSPGTIDCDYRGELGVLLINHGPRDFLVARGERIAQIVFAPYVQAQLIEAEDLSTSSRGAGGFGSTGVSTENA